MVCALYCFKKLWQTILLLIILKTLGAKSGAYSFLSRIPDLELIKKGKVINEQALIRFILVNNLTTYFKINVQLPLYQQVTDKIIGPCYACSLNYFFI